MAGCVSDEAGSGRSVEGNSSEYRSHFGDALAEWRSSEQLENGTPSTSPPYWDMDDNDDFGPKPSELYGKYTWKIENFSKINKRDHRSDAFEIGGYKWYILIYPQGCDVCNHLSLFLCVDNHDKFLPGWSHSAQFTIAVVNKDPKKSKYSDTLHRFWKKEHDWGWKKFIELSKISDGFVDSDTLIIKAQVQVIREKTDRLFRCLDCQYRRELVRIYLMNVEQICRRFVEERIDKLVKLIDDKTQWSSFCAFWAGVDQNTRRRMSKEKSDMILKIIVKDLFVEKEVTSTLVMDSLYSGLRALESQPKSKKSKAKVLEAEEILAPMVGVEKDMFVLADDALLLLERAVLAPLPRKDEKGPQNRTKDGGHVEDFNKDSIERNEKRLTELGRRTIEVFVLTHIFSNKIEVAYQEAVALRMQEELIREEEAAWQAEGEQKAKRVAAEKEKKSKKKQAKQKRNNRKEKDKGKDEKSNIALQVMNHQEAVDKKDLVENPDTLEDISDVSDSIDCVADSVDKYASHVNWETNTSEVLRPTEASSSEISSLASVQSGKSERKSSSTLDDSSSTCSTDSVQSVVINGPQKRNSYTQYKIPNSLVRERDPHNKAACEGNNSANETERRTSDPVSDESHLSDESEAVVNSLQDRIKWLEQHVVKKEEEVVSLQRKLSVKDQVDSEKPSKEKIKPAPSSHISPSRNLPSTITSKSESKINPTADHVLVMKSSSTNVPHRTEKASPAAPKATENLVAQQSPSMSRPSTAPTIPVLRPSIPVVSVAQTAPLVSRSVSATGWFDHNSTIETQTIVPQSYRNAMMGHSPIASTFSTGALAVSQSAMLRNNLIASTFSTGVSDALQRRPHLMNRAYVNYNQRESLHVNNNQNMDVHRSRSLDRLSSDVPVCTSSRQSNGVLLADDFPHIDIINDLLEDDHGVGNLAQPNTMFHRPNNDTRFLNGQFSSPSDIGMLGDFGPSANSCRFERTHSYHDSLREMLPQAHPRPSNYANSAHIDGLIPNQWQVVGSDLSIFGMQNTSYHIPEYSNVGFSDNGHTVFHPSNGRN